MARYQRAEQKKRRRVEIVEDEVEEKDVPQCSSSEILVDVVTI